MDQEYEHSFKLDCCHLSKQNKSQNGYVTNTTSELRPQILIMITELQFLQT